MCPFCFANLMLIAAGAASSGGLASLVIKRIFKPNKNAKSK